MKRIALVACLVLVILCVGSTALAETRIEEPRDNPYHVTLHANGKPQAFTIGVTGFAPGTQVFVEQCNDRPTSAENWLPARDCDIGTSPAAAIVDKDGHAKFSADDPNHAFRPFVGLSPQSLFRCMPPGTPPSSDDLPSYERCQIRVSTNNVQPTADQVFLPLVFGASTDSTGGSSRTGMILRVIAVFVVIAAVGILRSRRSRSRSKSRR
jgi:hypothetical protein